MSDLKHYCKLYDRWVGLALIPYYIERQQYLDQEIYEKELQSNEKAEKDV
jgi:hypothetical protein